ncbi:MAG: sigma-70 family RNA polymerase sigma factor [Armatimonas sp.]
MDDFEGFYRANLSLVHAVAAARGADPDAAEDLAQETFYRAWRSFSKLELLPPLAQRAWLVQTVRHLAIDRWRQRRSYEVWETLPEEPYDPTAAIALRLDLTRALGQIEELDRTLLVLRYVAGMNSREIGLTLEMPEGTVRSRLARGRRVLACQIAPPEGEPL